MLSLHLTRIGIHYIHDNVMLHLQRTSGVRIAGNNAPTFEYDVHRKSLCLLLSSLLGFGDGSSERIHAALYLIKSALLALSGLGGNKVPLDLSRADNTGSAEVSEELRLWVRVLPSSVFHMLGAFPGDTVPKEITGLG